MTQIAPNGKLRDKKAKFRDDVAGSNIVDAGSLCHKTITSPKWKIFIASGTAVDSNSGRVGTPMPKLKQPCYAT